MYKTILIDLDDTLWATQTNNKEAIHQLYLEEGWAGGYDSFDHFWSLYWPCNEALWHRYRHSEITKYELTIERFRRPLEAIRHFTEEEILRFNERFLYLSSRKTGVVEGAIELLQYLRSLYKVVVVSNGFTEVQWRKMEVSGIAPYIDATVLSEEVGISKPYKGIFDQALSRSHTRRSEAIMIGDSWDADILGAQNAKLPSIWFNPSRLPFPEQVLRYPVAEVARLDEIPTLLRRML